jgi:hypothetical protein
VGAAVIRHYYHVYADGQWREPVNEHLAALATITEPMHLTVGVVGAEEHRHEAMRHISSYAWVNRWVEADTGWEQVTLQRLRDDLASGHNSPVLYAHTKGASDWSEINVVWRQSMIRHVIGRWQECLEHLRTVDAVGCHWLTREQWPGLITTPIFGGNFWWANPSYLETLPPLRYDDRWQAEGWIGINNPTAHDLLPGWPSIPLCTEVSNAC